MRKVIIFFLLFSSSVFASNYVSPRVQKILNNFQIEAGRYMRKSHTPGMAIAIVEKNKIIFAKGFGRKKIGEPGRVNINTVFQIGSMSKSFTVAMMAKLVDEGKIKWDDRVIDYLPDFKMYDPWVTKEFRIEDLFAQYSGMPAEEGDSQVLLGATRDDVIHSLRFIKPITSFRSHYAYQNSLLLVAAAIEEKVTKSSWEELVKKMIFEPLGMSSSSADLQGYFKSNNRAWIHHIENGNAIAYAENWPFFDWVYTYAPAGGINSTVMDMAKWLQLQMNDGKFEGHQDISKENIAKTHRPHVYMGGIWGGDDQYYAMGWVYRTYSPFPILWHDGETSGAHSIMAIIPQKKLGIVILTNTINNKYFPEALVMYFFDHYFNNISSYPLSEIDKPEKPKVKISEPKIVTANFSPNNYVGKYRSDIYGDAIVKKSGDDLLLILGRKKIQFILKPISKDVFALYCPELFLEGETNVEFNFGPSGVIKSMTVRFLSEKGNADFSPIPK